MSEKTVVASAVVDGGEVANAIRVIHGLRSGDSKPDVGFTIRDGKLYAASCFGMYIPLGGDAGVRENVRAFTTHTFLRKTSKAIAEEGAHWKEAKVTFYRDSKSLILDVCVEIGGQEFWSDGDLILFQNEVAQLHESERVVQFSANDAGTVKEVAQFSDWMSEPAISELNAVEIDGGRAYATSRTVAASAPVSAQTPSAWHIRDVFSFIGYPTTLGVGFGLFEKSSNGRAGIVVGGETCTILDYIYSIGIAQGVKRMFTAMGNADADFTISIDDLLAFLRMVKRKKASYAIAENGWAVSYSFSKDDNGRYSYRPIDGNAYGMEGRTVYVYGYDLTPARARIVAQKVRQARAFTAKVVMNGESGVLYIKADGWEFSFRCNSADVAIRAIKSKQH